ncbi:MAG: hypothetical protein ACRDYY_15970 [Acidimicrobiales bacterium]
MPETQDWQKLAGVLLEALGDRVAELGDPMWARVLCPPGCDDGFDLAVSEEPDALLGWVATPDCQAVGVVATGKVHVEETPRGVPPGLAPGTTAGARMVCLVARDGAIAWQMLTPDGVHFDEAPGGGRMVDCLRRCFALPTDPAPASPSRLHGLLWLSAVLDAAATSRRQLSWRDVTLLHPAAGLIEDEGAALLDPADLPELVELFASACTWDFLRRHAGGIPWVGAVVPPDLAGWMDEGMFARWLLDGLPAPEQLISRIRPLVAPSTARRLAHAVRAAA